MAIYPLVKVQEEYTDGDISVYLQRECDHRDSGMTIIARDGFTLEEITDYCDLKAESRNNHSFVTAHRILAALLHRELGRDTATRIMLQIAERGGLDGMSGVGCSDVQGAYSEFGLKDDWSPWKLIDGEHLAAIDAAEGVK